MVKNQFQLFYFIYYYYYFRRKREKNGYGCDVGRLDGVCALEIFWGCKVGLR
jgi:hypothetical protein